MNNAGLVEKCKVGDVIDSVELWRVHLGEGIERDFANLEPPGS